MEILVFIKTLQNTRRKMILFKLINHHFLHKYTQNQALNLIPNPISISEAINTVQIHQIYRGQKAIQNNTQT